MNEVRDGCFSPHAQTQFVLCYLARLRHILQGTPRYAEQVYSNPGCFETLGYVSFLDRFWDVDPIVRLDITVAMINYAMGGGLHYQKCIFYRGVHLTNMREI